MAGLNQERAAVEIAHAASADEVVVIPLQVETGTTVEEAIHRSGILQRCPGIDLDRNRIGVFSRPAALDDTVADGDRIEIYRQLRADPKELRRRRAARRGER